MTIEEPKERFKVARHLSLMIVLTLCFLGVVWCAEEDGSPKRLVVATDSVTMEVDPKHVERLLENPDPPEVLEGLERLLRLGESTLREEPLNQAKSFYERRVKVGSS
jgi:hypothetical protein